MGFGIGGGGRCPDKISILPELSILIWSTGEICLDCNAPGINSPLGVRLIYPVGSVFLFELIGSPHADNTNNNNAETFIFLTIFIVYIHPEYDAEKRERWMLIPYLGENIFIIREVSCKTTKN